MVRVAGGKPLRFDASATMPHQEGHDECRLTFQQLALAADDFLEPENAFKLSVQADGQHIAMRFDIAPGYYLYRERLNVQTDPADAPVVMSRYRAGR